MKLSVAIITRNEERILAKTLESVRNIADEIVIVDNSSVDATVDIAKAHNAKIYTEDFKGYGPQKNSAIDKCTGDWVLNIDADEVVTPELATKIKSIVSDTNDHNVYSVKFVSICFGKKILHGGWSGFHRVRLFRKDAGRYDAKEVHEEFITSSNIVNIDEYIEHYTYMNVDEYLTKFARYSTQGADEYHKRGKKYSFAKLLFHSVFTFIKCYILRLGFLDGVDGLYLATATAFQTMTKYYKLRQRNFHNK